MKSSKHSIVGRPPGRSHLLIDDQAMPAERVLGEFSTIITLAVNRAQCVPCSPFDRPGWETLLREHAAGNCAVERPWAEDAGAPSAQVNGTH